MTTYNIDESREKDDDDGEDAHQGAVQSGLDYPFGKSLQRDWEKLGAWGKKQQESQSEAVSRIERLEKFSIFI